MKIALITGILNSYSIAYAIAEKLDILGYKLLITYQNDNLKQKIVNLTDHFKHKEFIKLDVLSDIDIQNLVDIISSYQSIDIFLHSIAFSDKNQLVKDFFSITRDNFLNSMNISCYSFIEMAKLLYPYMHNGSMLSLTYLGSQKVIPHYNVMGIVKAALETSIKYIAETIGKYNIRVNGLSAGPIKTISSFGISDFNYILNVNKQSAPLRRNVTLNDISNSAVYLLTEQSSGVTGEIHYVDCGYNILGMENPYDN